MFARVTVRASDLAASRRFYGTVLAPLGHPLTRDFALEQADVERPPTRHLHVAFYADSREQVDAFWRAGVDAGYASDGEPGPRPQYDPGYYGAFLLDPDGNSAEAVCGIRAGRGENVVDHLWIRVADLDESRRFWEDVAPRLGLRFTTSRPGRFHLAARDRSFAVVRDDPTTENAEVAFPAAEPLSLRDPDGNLVRGI